MGVFLPDRQGASESLIWMTNTADAFGHVTYELFGNPNGPSTASLRLYDPQTVDLVSIQTGPSTGTTTLQPTLQNLSYGYDALHNLRGRSDTITGLTEAFDYDNLNRLIKATNTGASTDIKTYQYDSIGNIISKSDVGTYSYNPSGPNSVRPHAVTAVSGAINVTYSYDANGNMLSGTPTTTASVQDPLRGTLNTATLAPTGVPPSANRLLLAYMGNDLNLIRDALGPELANIAHPPKATVRRTQVGDNIVAQVRGTTDPSLLAEWSLDEGSGTSATDVTGNGHTGTLTNGPVWESAGHFGGSLHFDGVNDYVQLNAPVIGNLSAFTLSVWVKTSSTQDGVLYGEESSTSNNPFVYLSVNENTVGDAEFGIRDDAGTWGGIHIGASNLNDGQWHLFTGVQESKSSRRLYIDGVLVAQGSTAVGTVSVNQAHLGKFDLSSTNNQLLGSLDEVRVYNRALSATEVQALAQGGPVNQPPTANAGADQSVAAAAAVTLAGSGSDPEGGALTYQWTQTAGPAVTLANAASASASFTAPAVSAVLTFQLTVTDNAGASASDAVNVTVQGGGSGNQPPIANAGADQSVASAAAVALAGSGSDTDGSITAYNWIQTAGPAVTLSAANTATASFTAPSVTSATLLTFQLTVTDNGGASGSDSVDVTVSASAGGGGGGSGQTPTARSIIWTSFNKPQSITGPSGSASFDYDANYHRIRKTTGTSTTTYVGKLYERVTTGTLVEEKYYIYAGGSLVAIFTHRNNGIDDTKYVHTDHLGSVNVITDDNGNVVERLTYDPFGKRRQTNGQDATGTITSGVNRGFTRHEHDDEVGLINMNARLYDPLLGRFITSDPVAEGIVGQGLNRYSYVRNNPLTLTDPTGNSSWRKRLHRALHRTITDLLRPQVTLAVINGNRAAEYARGLLPTALLSNPMFGFHYGLVTGDWRSVARATATAAVMAASVWAGGALAQAYTANAGLFTGAIYISSSAELGYAASYATARIYGASPAEAREAALRGAKAAGEMAALNVVAQSLARVGLQKDAASHDPEVDAMQQRGIDPTKPHLFMQDGEAHFAGVQNCVSPGCAEGMFGHVVGALPGGNYTGLVWDSMDVPITITNPLTAARWVAAGMVAIPTSYGAITAQTSFIYGYVADEPARQYYDVE